MNWQGAEQFVAELVEGVVTSDKKEQYRDIDVLADGCTYSVKLQKAAAKYGNISFEVELLDDSGASIPGNFARCEADYCCIVIPWPDRVEVLCFEHKSLKWWLEKQKYPVKGLTLAALATNDGRKFRFANNLIVPIAHLRPLAAWSVVEVPAHGLA